MAQNQENPPLRANVSLYGDDAVMLHRLKEILQAENPVRLTLTDVVHVALNKLYELKTNI